MRNELAESGHFTIHPTHLDKVLSETEYHLLELIRHELAIGTEYLSNSLIDLEIGVSYGKTIKRIKENLSKLGFITYVDCSPKGTKYKVVMNAISDFVDKINKIGNRVERLRFADRYREEHGLDALNADRIKRYTNSSFDCDRYNNEKSTSDLEYKETKPKMINDIDKIIEQINVLYAKSLNGEITNREFLIKKNGLIPNLDIKIMLDEEKREWIIRQTK